MESKNGTNKLFYKTEIIVTDRENKLMVTKGKGEAINWEIGIDIYNCYI